MASKTFRLGEAVVKINTMKMDMAEYAVSVAETASKSQFTEREMAHEIKAKMQEKYPDDIWQTFVGRNFGAFVSHIDGRYIYFYLGQMGVCVFAA